MRPQRHQHCMQPLMRLQPGLPPGRSVISAIRLKVALMLLPPTLLKLLKRRLPTPLALCVRCDLPTHETLACMLASQGFTLYFAFECHSLA